MLHPSFETDFAHSIYKARYSRDQREEWPDTAWRVASHVMNALPKGAGDQHNHAKNAYSMFAPKQAMPGGRYLYASGRPLHQVNNCVLLRCDDSREDWCNTGWRAEMSLMTGAGIGVYYGDVRPKGALIEKTGGFASGPVPKMCQINDTGRHVMSGGNRRGAIWAGLPWWHSDIFDFITIKDWPEEVKALKLKDPTFPAMMDFTNISVCLDDEFFAFYSTSEDWDDRDFIARHGELAPDGQNWAFWAHRVYDTAIAHMARHGEPGFSVDVGPNSGEVLRNACTEITSRDDSDVCNLGSLVLARYDTPKKFGEAVREMTLFLLAGTLYSDVPYTADKAPEGYGVETIRELNRRLGLGLIGVHEFLMKNRVRYGTDQAFEVLDPYMAEYVRSTEYAWDWADKLGISRPIATRALAPNGTIGIVAESTPSGDPLFAAAEIRQVKAASPQGDVLQSHVVVDPIALRLKAAGVPSDLIEDAYSIEPERRLRQQVYIQRHVDQSISSTVNIPAPITDAAEARQFGETLIKVLPSLRGLTVYPDGARAGQPRTAISLEQALNSQAAVFTDDATCGGGVCSV